MLYHYSNPLKIFAEPAKPEHKFELSGINFYEYNNVLNHIGFSSFERSMILHYITINDPGWGEDGILSTWATETLDVLKRVVKNNKHHKLTMFYTNKHYNDNKDKYPFVKETEDPYSYLLTWYGYIIALQLICPGYKIFNDITCMMSLLQFEKIVEINKNDAASNTRSEWFYKTKALLVKPNINNENTNKN